MCNLNVHISIVPLLSFHNTPQKGFTLSITTWHKPGRGEIDNVHNLEASKLALREVVPIDIANDVIKSGVGSANA